MRMLIPDATIENYDKERIAESVAKLLETLRTTHTNLKRGITYDDMPPEVAKEILSVNPNDMSVTMLPTESGRIVLEVV